jgi:hypothetical protein
MKAPAHGCSGQWARPNPAALNARASSWKPPHPLGQHSMGLPRILAGGPAREKSSLVYQAHVEGLLAQADGFDIEVRHEIVTDPGGARWQMEKIWRVAQQRQVFLEAGAYTTGRARIGAGPLDCVSVRIGSSYSALLMVDTDVILGPGVLKRMWEVDADVVFAVYWTFSDWGGSMADWPQVYDINPYGWYPETAEKLKAPGINEVEVLGGGACTLIRGRGFESHYWPLLKSFQPYRNMFSGEDRTYCIGLEARGIKQIAVTGMPIHHCYTLADQTRPALERIKTKVGL